MVRIGDILEELSAIETRTLRSPTHLLISKQTLDNLINQYNDLANSDAETVYEFGEKNFDAFDLSGFLGVQIVLSLKGTHEFKVLEEVTTDS